MKRKAFGTGSNRMGDQGWLRTAGISLLLAAVLTGCGAADQKSAEMASSTAAGSSAAAPTVVAKGAADQLAVAPSAAANNQAVGAGFNPTSASAEVSDPFNRKIIYTARLTMQVENYQEKQAEVQEAVRLAGGYVLQFNETSSASEKSAMLSIKVPANGFQSLLDRLEKIQPTLQKNLQGQDVTEEYVDLNSRLKAKQVAESRLLSFMEKASKTDELVAFSNELSKVQEEIERIKGRMRYLEQNVAYSTIELRIAQKIGSAEIINAGDRGPLMKRAAAALNGTYAVLSLVFQGLVVFAAGALPVLVLLALIGVPIWLVRRSRQAKIIEARLRARSHNEQHTALPAHADEKTESDEPHREE